MKKFMIVLFVIVGAFSFTNSVEAISVHTTDFISNGSRDHFVSFDSLVSSPTGPVSYTEDGVTVSTAGDIANNYSSASWTLGVGKSWFHTGGDSSFARIVLDSGNNFEDIGLHVGHGYSLPTPGNVDINFNYELWDDGGLVFSGFETFTDGYLGFSGGGFDEIRLAATLGAPFFPGISFIGDGTTQALAMDSIELSGTGGGAGGAPPIPEPSMMMLLGSGLIGLLGFNYKPKNQTV